MDPNKIALDEGRLTPEFLSKEEESLFAEAALGAEAVAFLNSDLGRVLRGFALQEIEAAKDDLLTTAPWRKRRIQQLQFRAAVAGQFLDFIREAVLRGDVAYEGLQAMRDEA